MACYVVHYLEIDGVNVGLLMINGELWQFVSYRIC